MMQPGCVICGEVAEVELVETKGGPAFVCKIHNNPAAIADHEAKSGHPAEAKMVEAKRTGPTAPPTELLEVKSKSQSN